jgi:hypothetical protein
MIIGLNYQIMPEMVARLSFCWTAQQSSSDNRGGFAKGSYGIDSQPPTFFPCF